MANPFHCGPNPCGWNCRESGETPFSCLQGQWVPGLLFQDSGYDVVSGSWSRLSNTVYSPTAGATLLNKQSAAAAEVYYTTYGVRHYRPFCFRQYILANDTLTSYVYGEWYRLDSYSDNRIAIGTQAGEYTSKTLADIPPSGDMFLCFDGTDAVFSIEGKNVRMPTSDNGYRRVGFGFGSGDDGRNAFGGPLGASEFLYHHKSLDHPECPSCPTYYDCVNCINGEMPEQLLVTIPTVTAPGSLTPPCYNCSAYAGNYIVTAYDAFSGACDYKLQLSDPGGCASPLSVIEVRVQIASSWVTVTVVGANAILRWRNWITAPIDCYFDNYAVAADTDVFTQRCNPTGTVAYLNAI